MAKKIEKNINSVVNTFQFAALNPYIVSNIPNATQEMVQGKDFVSFGDNNLYFQYLRDIYDTVPTLGSIINGICDYALGDEIICNIEKFKEQINKRGDTIENLLQNIIIDYLVYGGFSIQIIKNNLGEINELYYINFSDLRTDEKNTVIYYSKDWSKSYGRVKTIKYPKFEKGDSNPTSIFYYKDPTCKGTYPLPIWHNAILCAETEKKINKYNLNEISNNFFSSKLINLNSGIPDDNLKEEIEKNINEKFSGEENVGRVMISFNQNAESAPTVIDLGTDNLVDRYQNTAERCREQLFIAFRATPNLFGLPTATTGFNSQEYSSSFKLFNKTMIQPIQKKIVGVFDKIFGEQNTIEIKPFIINFEN